MNPVTEFLLVLGAIRESRMKLSHANNLLEAQC